MTGKPSDDLPTYQVHNGRFFCPKCLRGHQHSEPEKSGIKEHRVEHCDDPTAHPKGYYIVKGTLVSEEDP